MLRAIDFHGLKGVEFSKGEYTALLIPEMGANLVRLANTRLGAEILRTPGPGEIETFRSRPQVFGLPILFPPNRIADGRYVFEGRTYQYPITIERERNYHHGVLKSEAFLVSKARETDREVMIECRYYANAGNDAVYRDFPHEFKCKITYRLTAEGLEQEVVFFNRSETRMPLGVGFHTPLTIPFAGGIDADYVMRLAVGEEVELDGRNLPTGRRLPLSEQFSKLRREGLQVTGCGPIEAGFTLREIDVDGKPFRGALVEHLRTGVRTCYEVDEQTTYWTLWNNGGQVPYCCPEPQMPSYLRVHASEVSAQTMTAVGAPKSRVQRARRSMPSFDCTTTSRWGWRLAPVGATRPASRISSSFSGSTCLERYLRQAYRFFASFRKSICKGFNYIKVRTGRAIRNLPTGKKGRYASKGIKIRAVIQPGAPFWQVRLTEWQKKSTGTPFVAGRAGNQIQQQR